MPPTRKEQLEAVRNEWSTAIDGGKDIYDWLARAIPFIECHVDRFRFTQAVREVASRGRASPLHQERVAVIRSILATATADDPVSESIPATPTPMDTKPIITDHKHPLPAERDIPKVLAKEHGLFWLVMHCHWLARVKVFLFLFVIFGLGVQAAQSQAFMQVWTWMATPIIQTIKLLIK